MISIPSLWLPILLAAILVFVASSLIHMVLKYHANDFTQLPDEAGVMDALTGFDIPPGDYVMPYASSGAEYGTEEFKAKLDKGPLAYFTVMDRKKVDSMGAQFIQWFLYAVIVAVVAAYVAGRTLEPGADYLQVFRLTGTVAFTCYAMGLPQRSIWYGLSWKTTAKSMFDGLVYGALTAGAFGWLWPV